jgi:hypothetical protein
MMRSAKLLLSAVGISASILFIPAAWYLSPYIYASALVSAVSAGDGATVGRILNDEYQVRLGGLTLNDGLKQLLGGIPASDKKRRAFVLDATKDVLAIAVANGSIGPDAWARVLQGKGLIPLEIIPSEWRIKQRSVASSGYGPAMDVFRVEFRMSPTGEYASVVMSRQGWFRWRATGIEISSLSVVVPMSLQP